MSLPPATCITARHDPPLRTSILTSVSDEPSSPYHREKCSATVQAFHTAVREASKLRLMTSSCFLLISAIGGLLNDLLVRQHGPERVLHGLPRVPRPQRRRP